jgi:DinB superfamily
MIFNTIDDVFAANDDVRRRILARVEGLHEERANASEGGWSVAQIVEHLSITEPRITRAIEGMLAPAAGGGEPRPFAPFSLDEYAERARGKIEAPEFLRPAGLTLAEGLARLKQSRAALERLRPRFDAADYSALLQHPAFGPLNAAQWLAFVGMHEARHLAQIERTLEAMK